MLPKVQCALFCKALAAVICSFMLSVVTLAQITQAPAPDQKLESPKPENPDKPAQANGVFFAALRTQNHISRSSTDKFNEAVDAVEQFLTDNKVVLREDPVRTKFRLESTMSKENLIHVAEDAGAGYVLQLTVDRPSMAWIDLTMQCFDLQGKQLWEERGSGANQFSSAGHVQKAVKKLTSRLAPKLGSDCLPQAGASSSTGIQNAEQKK